MEGRGSDRPGILRDGIEHSPERRLQRRHQLLDHVLWGKQARAVLRGMGSVMIGIESADTPFADAERMKRAGLRLLAAAAVLAGIAVAVPAQSGEEARAALIARAKSFELDTPFVPPPGEAIDHHAAGFAKVMCSAVFITGLDPDFAAENVGYFTAPFEQRAKRGKPVIDRVKKTVEVSVPNRTTRTAVYLGDQGCVTLPIG